MEDIVTQLMGLLANDPLILACEILTTLSLELHPERLPENDEGPVPPPVGVSGGESFTLAITEHVTEPGDSAVEMVMWQSRHRRCHRQCGNKG